MRYPSDTRPEPFPSCRHQVAYRGDTGVMACGECGTVEFWGARGLLDPAEGMAALFGDYELVGPLPAIGAPASPVLAYAPSGRGRRCLDLLPTGAWLHTGNELWVSSDGAHLLLATPDHLMVENLTRGA